MNKTIIESPEGHIVKILKSPTPTTRNWYAEFQDGNILFFEYHSHNIQQIIRKVKSEIKKIKTNI